MKLFDLSKFHEHDDDFFVVVARIFFNMKLKFNSFRGLVCDITQITVHNSHIANISQFFDSTESIHIKKKKQNECLSILDRLSSSRL